MNRLQFLLVLIAVATLGACGGGSGGGGGDDPGTMPTPGPVTLTDEVFNGTYWYALLCHTQVGAQTSEMEHGTCVADGMGNLTLNVQKHNSSG